MALSMTGFGHGEMSVGGRKITCDIRSINNRYADIQIHLPRALSALETTARALCRDRLTRGKIDLSIGMEDHTEDSRRVFCDLSLAYGYRAALEELAAASGRPCLPSVSELAAYPGVLRAEEARADDEDWLPLLTAAVENALDCLLEMRAQEGERLTRDIQNRAQTLELLRRRVEKRAPLVVEANRARLRRRAAELLGDGAELYYDEQRLEAEVLLFADRAAIDEELVRLKSHLETLDETAVLQEPIGKKLDFMMQEINREVNTIGSKANDLEITRLVIEMKHEAEKIREQVQNLE